MNTMTIIINADPLATMCRRCTARTTPRTNTRDNRTILVVVEHPQSEAPDTCLKDLCSIHSRAWMVHKRIYYLLACLLFSLWNAAVVFHNLIVIIFLAFILCLIIFCLNNVLQNYSCVNVVFHHFFASLDLDFSFVYSCAIHNLWGFFSCWGIFY